MKKINEIRNEFTSLKREVNGKSVVYLDGPGGTQVPESVIDAISGYYKRSNANTHGFFASSKETDEVVDGARNAMATLLGCSSPDRISIGQNMT